MKAYAIKDLEDEIVISSIALSETLSKALFVNENYEEETQDWITFDRIGYRCVPVTITEVKTEK